MSKQDPESDINFDHTQHQENPQTHELQIHNTYNTTMHDKDDLIHDEYDTSENENTIEIERYEHYGEKFHETEESISTETSHVLTLFNQAIHHEDDSILQHMGFYHTTENPCFMMRVSHKTKYCECIIIHQDELYIASSTLQEILHIVKEKYKIKINPNNYLESNFPSDPGGALI